MGAFHAVTVVPVGHGVNLGRADQGRLGAQLRPGPAEEGQPPTAGRLKTRPRERAHVPRTANTNQASWRAQVPMPAAHTTPRPRHSQHSAAAGVKAPPSASKPFLGDIFASFSSQSLLRYPASSSPNPS